MSKISELLNNEIYPAIFETADIVFPEHDFKQYAGGWRSQTYLSGQKHASRSDKTVIRKNAIGYITEWGEGGVSIWDYVQKRDSLDQSGTLIKLAEMAGINLPTNLSLDQLEAIRIANKLAQIREDANMFFIDCLSKRDGPYLGRAQDIVKYLKDKRKYNQLDVRFPESKPGTTMELGFIPGAHLLFEYLITERKYIDSEVYQAIKLDQRIGETHILSIPYRDPVGKIRGFAFRTIKTDNPKYLYNNDLKKDDILFGLTSKSEDKDIVIVEGLLDAGIATARGVKNVVALGGSSINERQIRQAIKYGGKRFTLALDNDDAGKKATMKALELFKSFDVPVYIVKYPEEIKDADQLITTRGVDAFDLIVKEAERDYVYSLNRVLEGFDFSKTEFTDKETDSLLEKITELISPLQSIDRDNIIHMFRSVVADRPGIGGITKEALEAKADELSYNRDKEKQTKELSTLLKSAGDSIKKGETLQAIDLIETDIRTIKLTDSISEFKSFLAIDQSEAAIRLRLLEAPSSIKTGYSIQIDSQSVDIEIPAGVLSFAAAPTNHGKTAFLINVALNIVQNKEYGNKNTYFLTFEESSDKIMAYCLNAFVNEDLHAGIKQRNTILDYFKTGDPRYIKEEKKNDFIRKKNAFFQEFIEPKRFKVHYVNYDSDKLIAFIQYLRSIDPEAVILIDYIQKMRRSSKGNIPARQAELKMICEDLETCANITGLPIILGAQFNREVVSPQDMHPTKMAEASDIEKTASEIIGLWNCAKDVLNEKGGKTTKQQEAEFKYGYKTGDNEMILKVLKSRSMPTGDNAWGKLPFNGKTGKLSSQLHSIGFQSILKDLNSMF